VTLVFLFSFNINPESKIFSLCYNFIMTNWLVYFSLFLTPTYIFRVSVFGVPTNFFEIAVVLTAMVFIVEFLTDKQREKFNFGAFPIYLFLLAALFGTLVSADKISALGILKGWFVIPFILYLVIINCFDKKNFRYLTIPLFISLIVVSFWATLQKLGVITTLFYQVGDSGFSDYLSRFRAFGPFESPNYLAMFTVPMFFLTLPILGFFPKTIDKILVLVIFIFPLFAFYSSHSLGGLLAFGFGVVSFFAVLLVKMYRAKLLNSGFKITALATALIVSAVGFALIFSSISNDTYSNALRRDIYHYSFELLQSHPITGIGLGQFQSSVEKISTSNLGFQTYGLSYALHPHNLFLAFWLNLGLLGFLSLIYLIGNFFWQLGRRGGDILAIASVFAAMVAIVIHGLVDTTYFKNDLSAIFWLLLAVGATQRVEKRVKND